MLLKPIPLIYRKRHKPARRVTARPPGPGALMLVSAVYSAELMQLTLGFDRAIDLSGVEGAQIVVNDGAESGLLLDASAGATLLDPAEVRFDLNVLGGASGSETFLDASAGNGIVAVDDGGAWAGVESLELPFP